MHALIRLAGLGAGIGRGLRDRVRGYDRHTQLRPDIVAGVTVAAVAIPAGLGMAELAGLSPVAGLYATLVPLVAYACFGSSRHLIVGPDGTLAALTATAIAPIAIGNPAMVTPLAAVFALTVGAVQVAAGLMRLGFMAHFLSAPVLLGYANGVALIIIVSQLDKVLGVAVDAAGFFPEVLATVSAMPSTHVPTLVLSLTLFLLYAVLRRFARKVPAALAVVVVADLASVLFDLAGRGIAVVGDIPAGLPAFGFPDVTYGDWSRLAIAAAGAALVGFADASAVARNVAGRHGYKVDTNRELIGLGFANAGAGLTQGFAVGSSGSRTALNESTGGTSQVVSLVAAAVALVVTAFATPALEPLPTAVLGVVVIVSALGLLDAAGFRRLRRVRLTEAALAATALLAVLMFGVLGGLAITIAISVGVYVYRTIRPHDAVLASVSDLDGYRDLADHPEATTVPGLLVYRFDAPLYFPNAEHFTTRAMALVKSAPPRWFMLNAESINYIDATGVDALRALHGSLASRGVVLAVARAKSPLRSVLRSTGVMEVIGADMFFDSVRAGVAAFHRRL